MAYLSFIALNRDWDVGRIGARVDEFCACTPGLVMTVNGDTYACPRGTGDWVWRMARRFARPSPED